MIGIASGMRCITILQRCGSQWFMSDEPPQPDALSNPLHQHPCSKTYFEPDFELGEVDIGTVTAADLTTVELSVSGSVLFKFAFVLLVLGVSVARDFRHLAVSSIPSLFLGIK